MMTPAQFVRKHGSRIKYVIARTGSSMEHIAWDLAPDELEEWVMNDEYLYRWAQAEGVEEALC